MRRRTVVLGLQILLLIGCSSVLDSTPTNSTTWVEYSITSPTHVHLYILNSYDVIVCTLVDEFQAAANYSVEVDFGSYPEGVYYYVLEAGDFRDSHMFLVIP